MTHLDEGRLRALLDGELGEDRAEAARAHLAECGACSARLAEAEREAVRVGSALRRLDTAPVPAGAREAVIARVGSVAAAAAPVPIESRKPSRPHPRRARRRFGRSSLLRAAALVLGFGGLVATALPASPLRGWIGSGWGLAVEFFRGARGEPAPSLEPPAAAAPTQAPEPAGVRLEVPGGELLVRLAEAAPGTELDVRLTDGFQAAVFAPPPAGFRTSEGRIEVIGGSGRVRVDLPRSVGAASIEVNGRISVRKVGDRLDALGSVVGRSEGEVRLRVP